MNDNSTAYKQNITFHSMYYLQQNKRWQILNKSSHIWLNWKFGWSAHTDKQAQGISNQRLLTLTAILPWFSMKIEEIMGQNSNGSVHYRIFIWFKSLFY